MSSRRYLKFFAVLLVLLAALPLLHVFAQDNSTSQMLPGEIEIVGPLTSLDTTSAVVAGITFDISGAQVDAGLLPGDMVKVHALFSNNAWIAREIVRFSPSADATPEVTPQPGTHQDVEITGTVSQLDASSMTVSGIVFDISSAQMKGTVSVGDVVKVHAYLSDTNTWIATEVEVVAGTSQVGDDAEDTPEPEGTPEALSIPTDCVPSHPANWVAYTVQTGNTVENLAHFLDVDASRLAVANCMTDPLTPGSVFYGPAQGGDDHGGQNGGNNGGQGGDDHGGQNGGNNSGNNGGQNGGNNGGQGGNNGGDHGGNGGQGGDDSGHDG